MYIFYVNYKIGLYYRHTFYIWNIYTTYSNELINIYIYIYVYIYIHTHVYHGGYSAPRNKAFLIAAWNGFPLIYIPLTHTIHHPSYTLDR